jgi:hypothetical protein
MTKARLVESRISHSVFKDVEAEGATFNQSRISESDFSNAKLENALFYHARLQLSRFVARRLGAPEQSKKAHQREYRSGTVHDSAPPRTRIDQAISVPTQP